MIRGHVITRRHRYFRLIWTFDSSLGIPRLKESNLNIFKKTLRNFVLFCCCLLFAMIHHIFFFFFACSVFSLRNVGRMIDVVKWCAFLLFLLHKVAHKGHLASELRQLNVQDASRGDDRIFIETNCSNCIEIDWIDEVSEVGSPCPYLVKFSSVSTPARCGRILI